MGREFFKLTSQKSTLLPEFWRIQDIYVPQNHSKVRRRTYFSYGSCKGLPPGNASSSSCGRKSVGGKDGCVGGQD
ncbi:hypothetical protein TNCV_420781 [Trichonephila clavipes]|nr:hypothetical protein TNCV_420781 [Trichonephila clavipes]